MGLEDRIQEVSETIRASEEALQYEMIDEERIADDIRRVGEGLPKSVRQKLEIDLRLIALEARQSKQAHEQRLERITHRIDQLLQRTQALAEYRKLREQKSRSPEAMRYVSEQLQAGTNNPYLRLVYERLGTPYKLGQNDCVTVAQLLKRAGVKNADGSDLPYYENGDQFWREVGKQVAIYSRWEEDFSDVASRYRSTEEKVYLFLFVENPVFRTQKDVQHIAVSDGLGGMIHASSLQNEVVIDDVETYLQGAGEAFQQVLVLEVDLQNPVYTAAERLVPSRTQKLPDGAPVPRAEDLPIMANDVPVYEYGAEGRQTYRLEEWQLDVLDAITPDPDMQRRIVATIIRESGRGGFWTTIEELAVQYAPEKVHTRGPAQLGRYAIPSIEDYFDRLTEAESARFSETAQALYRRYKQGKKTHQIGTRKTVLTFEDVRAWFDTFEGAAIGVYATTLGNAAAIESAYRAMGRTYPGDQDPDVRVAVESAFRYGSRPVVIAAQQYMIRRIAKQFGIVNERNEYLRYAGYDGGVPRGEQRAGRINLEVMKIDGALGAITGQVAQDIFQHAGIADFGEIEKFYSERTSAQHILQSPIAQELHKLYRTLFNEDPPVVVPREVIRQDDTILVRRGLHTEEQRRVLYEADLRAFAKKRDKARQKNPGHPIPEVYEAWLARRDIRLFERSELGKVTMERQQAAEQHLERVYERHPELRSNHPYWMAQVRKESSYRWNAISSHGYVGLLQLGPLAALDGGIPVEQIFMGKEWLAMRQKLVFEERDKAAWNTWQREVYAPKLLAAYREAYHSGTLKEFQKRYPLFDPERNVEIGTRYYTEHVLPKIRDVYTGIPGQEVTRIAFLGYNDIGVSTLVGMKKYGYIRVQEGQQQPTYTREEFQRQSQELSLAPKDTAKKLLQDLARAAGSDGLYWFDETNNTVRWLTPKTIATGYRYLYNIEKWRQQLEGVDARIAMR